MPASARFESGPGSTKPLMAVAPNGWLRICRRRPKSFSKRKMNKAVGIIPARWSSTRFPGKPLHPIANKPLLRRVWERCVRARQLNAVIIATDDMRIAKAAFDWGAEVAMTSKNHQSGTDRVAEVVRRARQFDFILNIQGDEPLTEHEMLNRFVETLLS